MRKLLCFIGIFLLMSFIGNNTAYDYSVTDLNGDDQSLAQYAGKTMMIVVLPSTQEASDTLLLHQIDSLKTAHLDSLVILGIPSYEDGFQDDSLSSLSTWYKSLGGDSLVICQGMNTRKNSPYQSGLFQWLTDKDLNGHFDDDVPGAAAKYFINKSGNLYAVINPEAQLSDPEIDTLLQRDNY